MFLLIHGVEVDSNLGASVSTFVCLFQFAFHHPCEYMSCTLVLSIRVHSKLWSQHVNICHCTLWDWVPSRLRAWRHHIYICCCQAWCVHIGDLGSPLGCTPQRGVLGCPYHHCCLCEKNDAAVPTSSPSLGSC